MAGKKISYLVVAILLLVASIAGYLFYRLARYEPVLAPNPENIGKRTIPSLPTDPIKKFGTENGLMYQIEGSFEGQLTQVGGLLEGDFIIRGDPDRRKIKTFLGSQQGTVIFGTYKDSFLGDVTWRPITTDELLNFVTPGRPILIRVDFVVQGDPKADVNVAEDEIVLDTLIDDFREGLFDSKIPRDFALVALHVAITQ